MQPGSMLSSDPDQEAVLADDSRRLLITAPPGSGKTVTAIRLAGRDVDQGLVGPTQRVLILTFSLQARAQLETYSREILPSEQRRQIEITNYHAWFWSKVRQFRSSLGLPLDLDLSTQGQHEADVLGAMIAAGVAGGDATWKGTAASDYAVALEHGVEGCRPDRLLKPLDRANKVGDGLIAVHRGGRLHYDDLAYYMWRLIDESENLRRIWRHKYPVIVLDEYQDTSPIQAKIVERLAGDAGRVYAFADRLQMIYGWRDASPQRITDFENRGASSHTLKTLHRYRNRPRLRKWMEGVRDILLGGDGSCPAPPDEVEVTSYDPSLRIKGDAWDAPSRELWQLNGPISRAFQRSEIQSIAVLYRKHDHLGRLESHLSKTFFCKRLRTARETTEWARDWIEACPTATSDQLKMERLMEVALRVAPRNEDLLALRDRIDIDGIRVTRLGERRRGLGGDLNEALSVWTNLPGACAAAQIVAQVAKAHENEKLVAGDAAYVVRTALRARSELDDADAKERIATRLAQLRFTTEGRELRGLYLLTCHEANLDPPVAPSKV